MARPSMHSGSAGFVTARRTGPDLGGGRRGWVTVYDGPCQGIPAEDGGRWAVVCEEHGTLCQTTNKDDARAICRGGSTEFCDECREAEDKAAGLPNRFPHRNGWRDAAGTTTPTEE